MSNLKLNPMPKVSQGTAGDLMDRPEAEERAAAGQGRYGAEILRQLMRLLGPASVSLDIGANSGGFACMIGRELLGSAAKVYAFEPDALHAAQLQEQIEAQGLQAVVRRMQIALGRSAAQMQFGSERPAVPVRRLDEWGEGEGLKRCDLIHIAVSGQELAIFEGGRAFLERHRPVILGEMRPFSSNSETRDVQAMLGLLQGLRYICFRESESRFFPMVSAARRDESQEGIYLLMPSERMRWNGFEWGIEEA